MIKGTIDSYELWQSRPENLNENMEDEIKAAENRGWNQCNRSWIKTIEEQPRVGAWIPCGKEKPRGGENIATVKWYDGTIEVVHAYYDGFDWITGCGERAEVIAWMSLPEPYKEGE